MPTATHTYQLAQDDPRAAWAIFTVFEASRYLGVPNSTLRAWIEPNDGLPLVSSFERRGHQPRLSFIGFAEAFVISAARRAGVKPHRIREGVEAVRKSIGVDYALATHRLYVDKAELLVAPEGGVDVEEPDDLEVARTRQLQMTRTVKKQLRHISYGEDGVAASLTLPIFTATTVIVDPLRVLDLQAIDVVARLLAAYREEAIRCNDEQAEWIRELKRRNPEYGYARLAEITGLNRDTVRRVLGRKKPS